MLSWPYLCSMLILLFNCLSDAFVFVTLPSILALVCENYCSNTDNKKWRELLTIAASTRICVNPRDAAQSYHNLAVSHYRIDYSFVSKSCINNISFFVFFAGYFFSAKASTKASEIGHADKQRLIVIAFIMGFQMGYDSGLLEEHSLPPDHSQMLTSQKWRSGACWDRGFRIKVHWCFWQYQINILIINK